MKPSVFLLFALVSAPACPLQAEVTLEKIHSYKETDFETPDDAARPPLHEAVLKKDNGAIQHLIAEKGADPNVQDQYGHRPLHYAARINNVQSIRILIDHGADPDLTDRFGHPPLIHALRKRHKAAIRALLDNGANPGFQHTQSGLSFLHYAVSNNDHGNALLLIIKKGADPDLQDKDGNTPLHHALKNKYGKTPKMLMEKGAKLDIPDHEGITPAMLLEQ